MVLSLSFLSFLSVLSVLSRENENLNLDLDGVVLDGVSGALEEELMLALLTMPVFDSSGSSVSVRMFSVRSVCVEKEK